MLVYRVKDGLLACRSAGDELLLLRDIAWDQLFNGEVSQRVLQDRLESQNGEQLAELPAADELLAPIQSQEVWAAGVTYLRSRTARMEESAQAGGSDFYDLVYNAHRPELFFKATPHRVVGHRQSMSLRTDSKWMVPEPELTLAFSSQGELIGYTIGNDLSSRDIEGENPLYLPQAKVFDRCAALGPGLWLSEALPPPETKIELSISRGNSVVFGGETQISQMKQTFENLREHLFHDNSFPLGCYLMTGTGIVPSDDFTLRSGDEVAITIEPVGTLVNSLQ